jgi:outer membrane lipoprotein-sorting protein
MALPLPALTNCWTLMRICSAVLLLLLPLVAISQPKGFTPVKNTDAFRQSLSAANAGMKTVSSNFEQVKNLSMLQEKIKSKGKFYFSKEDKVRIEYTSPYYYLMVMNAGMVMIKDEQKTSKINAKGSKTMQSVNRIMMDCMRGTVFQNPDFKVTAHESAKEYLLMMEPATDAMKKLFKRIDVLLNRKDLDVARLTMTEPGGDYTDMNFNNTQHNIPLNEALFKVK